MMDAGSGTSPEVSVVIASFQTREFTRACLASPERHGEDLDWCPRVSEADTRVHYVPQAEVYYIQWRHRALRGDPRLAEANR